MTIEFSSTRNTEMAKVDLHLHSYASNVTDYYTANLFSIPESYSDPIETYWKLKNKGMNLVTLTDHNSIDGVLKMLDQGLPDVFIRSEMTTTFPEDGCNIHVTLINMTESQFQEIDRLRTNIYEMIAYIQQEIHLAEKHPEYNQLAYFMTHPLMSTQNRPYGREGGLSLTHIEKAILLCPCLETKNGTRTKVLNETTQQMLDSLNEEKIEQLVKTHQIQPYGETPWQKAYVGGSDDHSGLNPGETYTWFPIENKVLEMVNANDLVMAIRHRKTIPDGADGGLLTLAHAVTKIMYQHQFHAPKQKKTSKSIQFDGSIHE